MNARGGLNRMRRFDRDAAPFAQIKPRAIDDHAPDKPGHHHGPRP
jgi:hypothetical protein